MADPYVEEAMTLFDQISLVLVGIGAVEPSELLADSEKIFSEEELEILPNKGTVGDSLLHFFDKNGEWSTPR